MIYKIPMVLADEYVHAAYGPCRVLGVHGFNNNGADRYLQFHEEFPAALANGDVPAFKSLWFPAGAQSVFGRETFGDSGLSFSELLAAVSSTEVNYTAVTNTGLDLTIQLDTSNYAVGMSIAGDLSTGVDSKQIWSVAAGPKKLYRLDITNAAASTIYPFIQAINSIGTDTKATVTKFLPPIPASSSKTYLFGPGGGQVQNRTTSALQEGCIVGLATAISSAGVVTESATTNHYIRALYE